MRAVLLYLKQIFVQINCKSRCQDFWWSLKGGFIEAWEHAIKKIKFWIANSTNHDLKWIRQMYWGTQLVEGESCRVSECFKSEGSYVWRKLEQIKVISWCKKSETEKILAKTL